MGFTQWPVVSWTFLDEPAYRWAMFVVMLTIFIGAWNEVLRHMGAR